MPAQIPKCGCGCGLDRLEGETVTIAELLCIEFPEITWTRGASCPEHNAAVGGSPDSGHLAKHGANQDAAVALDGTITPWDSAKIRRIAWRAYHHGAKGVGIYPPAIRFPNPHFHLDRKPRIQLWKRGPLGRLQYFFP